jgi:hypothetical protein
MADDGPLQCLAGKIIVDAISIHDYVQLAAEEDIRLSIYNEFWLSAETHLLDLVGGRITAVSSSENEVELHFEGPSRLVVNLRASAWRGPEAMQLERTGQPLVVWNEAPISK